MVLRSAAERPNVIVMNYIEYSLVTKVLLRGLSQDNGLLQMDDISKGLAKNFSPSEKYTKKIYSTAEKYSCVQGGGGVSNLLKVLNGGNPKVPSAHWFELMYTIRHSTITYIF